MRWRTRARYARLRRAIPATPAPVSRRVPGNSRTWMSWQSGTVNRAHTLSLAELSWAMRSDVGPAREHNEDYLGTHVSTAPDDACDRAPRFVIADGMGGHSPPAVSWLRRCSVAGARVTRWSVRGFRARFRAANRAVIDAPDTPGRRGMGTAKTALSPVWARRVSRTRWRQPRVGGPRRGVCAGKRRPFACRGDAPYEGDHTPRAVAPHAQSRQRCAATSRCVPELHCTRLRVGALYRWTVGCRRERRRHGLRRSIRRDGRKLRTVTDVADRVIHVAVNRRTADNVSVVVVQVCSDRPFPAEPRRSLFCR